MAEVGLFAPVAGLLADRFGARKLVIWGVITVGIGLLILSRTQTPFVFYLSVVLTAFGAGGCTAVVLTTVIANWFHKKIGAALGLMGAGIGGGGLIVMLLPQLIQQFQWRITLVILALGTWVLCIPLALMIRNRPEEYGEVPDGNAATSPVRTAVKLDQGIEMGFKETLRDNAFIYLNIAEVIRMMAITAVMVHVMPYLDSIGFSEDTAGLIAGAIPLCGIAGRLGFGWLGDRINKRYMLTMTYALLSLGTLAFSYAQAIWPIFLFLLCFPLGHGGSMVLRGAIVREYFGRASFGKLIGIILGAGAIGGVIGPTLAGRMFDIFGNYDLIWFILCGLTGLATVMITRIK